MNYSVYELLYSKGGYHAGTADTHGIPLVHDVLNFKRLNSVLDVGCSHGDVVQRFWNSGINSSGMDVSKTAVKRAYKIRGNSSRCVDKCFKEGSATHIP